MKKSKNNVVQKFLDDLNIIDSEKSITLNALRDVVLKIYPKTDEKIMYGGILFSLNSEAYGGLFVSKNHITFEFSKGFLMSNPKELLEGSGKYRRHLKIRSRDDIINKEVEFYVKQSI